MKDDDESELNDKIIKELFNSIHSDDFNTVKTYFIDSELQPWLLKNKEGCNPLHTACFRNFTLIAFSLIEETKPRTDAITVKQFINEKESNGDPPIHYASYRGNIELIKYLVENGADINVKNDKGLNVMHLASQGDSPASLVYFKEYHNFDYTLTDNIGSTPLHWACYTSSEFSFQFLLSFENINLNVQDNDGVTPLHCSVMAKKGSIIKKLLQNNVDKTIKDKKGRTAYDLSNDRQIKDIINSETGYAGYCAFGSEIRKNNRTAFNVYICLLLHFIIEVPVFITLLPCKYYIKF